MLFTLCRTSVNAIENVSSASNEAAAATNSEVTTSAAVNVDTIGQGTINEELTTSAAVTTGVAVTVDMQEPTAPTNLTASSITSTSCILSWTASTDNVGVTEYDIYNVATKIGSTIGERTFEVTGLIPNTAYNFAVVAKDAVGNASEASSALSVTTSTGAEITTNSAVEVTTGVAVTVDMQAPTAPTNLTASSITSTSYILSWTASTDNVGVTKYDIYNVATKIGSTTGETTFEVTGLTPNTSYSFTVIAKDAAGNTSLPSSILAVTTLAPSITISSNLKLTGDSTYQDITLTGGTLDLNGHKLTVNGNLTQTGGTIFIDGGQLSVVGDYTISNSSYFQMMNSSDYVSVGGNFLMNSSNSSSLTSGTLEIKGNFTQKNCNNYSCNFVAGGSHKVILDGTGDQTVSFESTNSYFNILDCSKATKVIFSTVIKPITDIIGTENIKCALNLSGSLKLTKDMSFNNEGDITFISGTLDLNGHKLTINRNLVQTGGTIVIDGGQLSIVGGYTISNSSYFQMMNSSDYVSVGGNFLMNSSNSSSLTSGTLEIKGNFTQKNCNNYSCNFVASGTHKVILYGTVSFDSTNSHFNILVQKVNNLTLNNTSLNLEKGNTSILTATVSPSNAAITWSSSNTSVATVDANGKVTAVGVGTATITCTASDGSGKSATCDVVVTEGTDNAEVFDTEERTETMSITVQSNKDIVFNDQNITWNYIGVDVLDYLNTAKQAAAACRSQEDIDNFNATYQPTIDRIKENRNLNLNSAQLEYIFLVDPDGVRDYLYGKPEDLINDVYVRLTGKEPVYYAKTVTGWEVTDRRPGTIWDVASEVTSDAHVLLVRGDGMPHDLISLVLPTVSAGLLFIGAGEIGLVGEGIELFGARNAITMYTNGTLLSTIAFQRGLNGLTNSAQIADEIIQLEAGTWEEGWVIRGDIIDDARGNNLGHNFPVADKLEDRILTSTKSIDTAASTYQKRLTLLTKLKAFCNQLNKFDGVRWNGVTVQSSDFDSKVLELVIPDIQLSSEQLQAIIDAKTYAQSLGLTMKIIVGR